MGLRTKIDRAVQFVLRAVDTLQEHARLQPFDEARPGSTYDGKTLGERQWESIGILADEGWRGIRDIGVYGAHLHGELVYIGRVTYRQGFHWRMQQYNSGSRAGNTTPAAKRIHANRHQIEIRIIRMNSVEATKELEKALIAKYSPPWNDHHNS